MFLKRLQIQIGKNGHKQSKWEYDKNDFRMREQMTTASSYVFLSLSLSFSPSLSWSLSLSLYLYLFVYFRMLPFLPMFMNV